VEGKAPKYDAWNQPRNLLTPSQLLSDTPPSSLNPTGFGLTSGRWSGTMAVDFDTKPERPEQAEATFRNTTGHSSDDLPPSATVVSGRPGRRRMILRVPAEWNALLSGYSAELLDLELRWEGHDAATGAPKPIQSVICGQHPGSPEWFFRWQEGLSPDEVGIAEAPLWLLGAMVRQKGIGMGLADAGEAGGGGRAPGEPGPCDLLDPFQQRKLVKLMSEYWPYRGGVPGTRFQASWDDDGFSGLLGALYNLFGAEMAFEWVAETEWFKSNENFGATTDFLKSIRSVGKSSTNKKAGWGVLWHLATRTRSRGGVVFKEPGMQPPKWALPPRELNSNDLAVDTKKKVEQLKNAMKMIEELPTALDREVAHQNLKQTLNFRDREMSVVVRHLQEEREGLAEKGGKLMDVLAAAKPISVAVERFLPFGAVTMLGADPGTGKTALLYGLARAAAYGEKFAGELQCVQGNVLIVQKDESEANLHQKAVLMGLQDPENRIDVKFEFSGGHFPELQKWIEQTKARYVLMDSFASLFAGGADLSDSEAGLYLYQLNAIAARHNVAVLLSHHLRKLDKSRSGKRMDVTLNDFYGSTFVAAGASDAWGLYKDPSNETEDIKFILKNVKPRSGIALMGDKFLLEGSTEDLSLHVELMNDTARELENLREGEQRLLRVLRSRSEERPILVTHPDPDETDLKRELGMSKQTINRLLSALISAGKWGVKRRSVPMPAKGKNPLGYWV